MDVTVEEKLRLLQKLKEDESQNQNAIRMRSEILDSAHSYREAESDEHTSVFSFKIRMLFAIVLFFVYLVMHFCNWSIGAVSAEKIVDLINESSDIKAFDFPLRVPYTLKE